MILAASRVLSKASPLAILLVNVRRLGLPMIRQAFLLLMPGYSWASPFLLVRVLIKPTLRSFICPTRQNLARIALALATATLRRIEEN